MAVLSAKAAEILAYGSLDLRKFAWLPLHRRLALRRGEGARRRLVPPRPRIDLNRAVLYIIVLVTLIEITAAHRAFCCLARVDRVAAAVLRREVAGPKILLLASSCKGRLVCRALPERHALEEFLLLAVDLCIAFRLAFLEAASVHT